MNFARTLKQMTHLHNISDIDSYKKHFSKSVKTYNFYWQHSTTGLTPRQYLLQKPAKNNISNPWNFRRPKLFAISNIQIDKGIVQKIKNTIMMIIFNYDPPPQFPL